MGGVDAAADDRGLLDTSIFIAQEVGRPLGLLPEIGEVSVVTIGELYLGVLLARDPVVRSRRVRTFDWVRETFAPLAVDALVASLYGELIAEGRRQGRRLKANDTWIAATALAHDLPVYTQDEDFAGGVPPVRVVRV